MGTNTQTKSTWQESWHVLFKDSPQTSKISKEIRNTGFHHIDGASTSRQVMTELRRLTGSSDKSTPEDIEQKLKATNLNDLKVSVEKYLSAARSADGALQKRREVGWRKARADFQNFAEAADNFLGSFEGVAEILKIADGQAMGAASFVLSILFVTVKLKASNDHAICSSLQRISNRLPDLQIYQKVYADDKLAELLCSAYVDVIAFAQMTTEYCQGGGLGRVLDSLAHPQKFREKEKTLQHNFDQIRIRCEALMAERISDLSRDNQLLIGKIDTLNDQVDALNIQVTTLTQQVEGSRERDDRVAAHEWRQKLGRHNSEPMHIREQRIAEDCKLLVELFKQQELKSMMLEDLKELSEYQQWLDVDASMLILHGSNHHDCAPGIEDSWLSLAALQMVSYVRTSSDGAIVTHVNGTRGENLNDLITSVIDQLLEQRPQVIRSGSISEDLEYGFNLRSASPGSPGVGMRRTGPQSLEGDSHIIAQIIRRCQCPVYMILNRPELSAGKEMWRLIAFLSDLVAEAPSRLKVMVVMRTEIWNIQSRKTSLNKSLLDSKKIILVQKDQVEY